MSELIKIGSDKNENKSPIILEHVGWTGRLSFLPPVSLFLCHFRDNPQNIFVLTRRRLLAA